MEIDEAMSEQPIIRRALAGDETAVRACVEDAYAHYVPLIGRKPAPMLADYAAQIAAGQVYVATQGSDTVLGLIVFFPVEQSMFLENVAVCKAAAGKGIGKSLIRFCEDEARRLGLASVSLYTNERMVDNLGMYPRLGYVEVGRRREAGFDRVFFEKFMG
ncbi:MAG: GNAT family N-acetyltransferase [Burkholderiaceae bacterium]